MTRSVQAPIETTAESALVNVRCISYCSLLLRQLRTSTSPSGPPPPARNISNAMHVEVTS